MTGSKQAQGVDQWILSILPQSGYFYPDDFVRRRMQAAGRCQMTWLYILSGIVVTGLLIYLIAALLNPEDFS
jgi:K+-transporting ATPase KdpF subunit